MHYSVRYLLDFDPKIRSGQLCNINGKTMEATKQAMKTPTRFTFEVAAGHVYLLLLKKDCYPRFIRSENYKSILANAINPGNVRRR